MILLSNGCSAKAFTKLFAPAPNVMPKSRLPSEFNRAIRFSTTPSYVVNEPPTSSCPSGCSVRPNTESSAPVAGANEPSTTPAASSSATCARGCPPTVRNSPPTKTLPSGRGAIAFTVPSKPLPASNVRSTAPFAPSRARPLRTRPFTAVKPPPTSTRPSTCSAST